MKHEFIVKETGTRFFYDNMTNALFDKDMNQLSYSLGDRSNGQIDYSGANISAGNGRVEKSNAPTEIKIVFGHKCNFSCGYCVQKDVGDHDSEHMSRAESKTRATALIQSMRENLDLSNLDQLELWGGEIFLFWPEVQEVMLAFDAPEFDFVMPTNGSLLKEKHIEFFKHLQGRVTLEISHDGPIHEVTRGPDFLDKKTDVFRMIQDNPDKIRAVINCVISKNNHDLMAINDYFKAYWDRSGLEPFPFMFYPVISYDKNSHEHSFDEFEKVLEQYGDGLEDYLNAHIEQFKRLGSVRNERMIQNSLFHIARDNDDNNGVLQWAAKMRSELDLMDSTICGMHQTDKLVIDISGNIKACQNVGEDLYNGNIMDFAMKEIVEMRGMKTDQQNDKCHKCPVKLRCLHGCPLELDDDSFEANCQLSFTHNMTILMAAFKIIFNSEVEWVSPDAYD